MKSKAPHPEVPGGFVERMAPVLGDRLSAFLSALAAPASGLRVNTLRTTAADFAMSSPFPLEGLSFPGEGFIVGPDARPGRHPYHAAGVYYLQDPGAMVVGGLVGAMPGERVLDLAAAPGGKATHLAARMRGRGVLVANDVSRTRATELARNLERCGVRNAIVTCEPVQRLAAHFGAYFDRVLVDAPCSGESMFHKSAAACTDWSEEAVLGCARRQAELIEDAARLVRPGGLLVYSTCTFSDAENEHVMESFLASAPEFRPAAELQPVPGAEVVSLESGHEPRTGGAAYAYRLWPDRVPGAGHFVAALRRSEGDEPTQRSLPRAEVNRESLQHLTEFMGQSFPEAEIPFDRLVMRGSSIFEAPDGCPSLAGMNVPVPGLALGSAEKGRFVPSHALAMAAPSAGAANRLDLPVADPRVARYLEGHPVEASGDAGWTLLSVDGFPLGWGKRVGNTVKNHYPKGLRRLA